MLCAQGSCLAIHYLHNEAIRGTLAPAISLHGDFTLMTLDHQTVERFAESLRSRGKQPATIESYSRDAQGFVDYLQRLRVAPCNIEPETLLAYQIFLRSDMKERDNSVRRTVIGIRQFFRFLNDSGVIKATPFDCVAIPVRDDRIPKGLKTAEVETLLATAAAGKPACKASRDAALVGLLAYEGIKANELIGLRWRDLMNEDDVGSLHISGARARAIRLAPTTLNLIRAYRVHYREIRHPAILSSVEKHMFVSFKGRDASSPLPKMTRHGLKFILYELGEKNGLDKLNTEQLRHFAVTHLISLGKPPEEIMGHLGLRRLGNIAKHLASSRPSAPVMALSRGEAGVSSP